MTRIIRFSRPVLLILYGLALMLTAANPSKASQADVTIVNTTVPAPASLTNPCVQEVVLVSGDLHLEVHFTRDSSGGVHEVTHFNAQGVTGEGSVTGAKYQVHCQGACTAEPDQVINVGGATEATTKVGFSLIGQGTVPNFVTFFTFHITINANGTVTAFVVETREECQ
jgi:hypothetical protein